MTTPDLDALLKIAEDCIRANNGAEMPNRGDRWRARYDFQDAFNPTVAKALVRVAQAASNVSMATTAAFPYLKQEVTENLAEALSALTLALKGSNHGQ